MIHARTFCFARYLLVSCFGLANAYAIPNCTFEGKSVNPNDGNQMQGKSGKVTCKDSDSGKLQSITEYQDGKQMGYQLFVAFNGEKTERTVNEKGNSIGVEKKFDSRGNLVREENYAAGKKPGWTEEQGTSKTFYPNGKISILTWMEKGRQVFSVSYREDGRITALQCGEKSFLPEDKSLCGFGGSTSNVDIYAGKADTIVQKLSYLNGKRQAVTLLTDNKVTEKQQISGSDLKKTEYFEDGKPKIQAAYKDHQLDGEEKEFHSSGKLVRLTHWKAGKMVDEETLFLNGKQKSSAEKKEIKSKSYIARKSFFDDGKLQEDGIYLEQTGKDSWMGFSYNRWMYEQPVGLHRTFFDNGQLASSENYSDAGELEGQKLIYDQTGQKRLEETYAKNVLKHRKEWSETGKLTTDDEFFEDGSRSSTLKSKPSEI